MRATGDEWETRALQTLQRAGLRLIQRNWHCRYGEIDLVMQDGDAIVFVEVRYRDASAPGGALASVGAAKQSKLVRAAGLFLAQHPALAQRPCRFDVVAFDAEHGSVRCDWQRNAFDAF
jgi:putative endonuclease